MQTVLIQENTAYISVSQYFYIYVISRLKYSYINDSLLSGKNQTLMDPMTATEHGIEKNTKAVVLDRNSKPQSFRGYSYQSIYFCEISAL